MLKELDPKLHLWLVSLCQKLNKDTAEKLVLEINNLSEKDECEYADSVLQVAMKENKDMFLKLKEASTMCEELAKLMEPEMREAKRIAEEEGRKAGMKAGMEQGLQAGMEQGLQAGMEQGLQEGRKEGRKEGEQAGINLSITIINQLRDGKNIEEIAKETGAAVNVIETICKSLGLE